MTYKISDSTLDLINDITILYDKTPILFSKFYEFLEKKHPGKNIDYWNQVKNDTLKKLSQSRKSYNDLPEPERTNFFNSIKVTSCIQQLINIISFLTTKPFFQYYIDCNKPEFLNAKKALKDNLPMLIQKSNKEHHLDFQKTFWGIPEIQQYFSSFIFNMKNKHSGKYELVIGKKVHFPTSFKEQNNSAIFRFMDTVKESFAKAIYDENENILNENEIIRSIFLPQIWNGCQYCEDQNFITFNHKDGTVDEISDEQCFLAHKDTSKQISQITTNGKLIFCNDVRIISNMKNINEQITNWGISNNLSTYLNTWDGQQGFMTAYAQLFNVGYIQAGNHGACLKKYKNGLKVTYGKDTSDSLAYISLSLWAVCFIDYDKAIELAGSEQQLLQDLQKSEHYIVDVKPGTYKVISDSTVNEEKSFKSKKDLAFGKIEWLHS